MSKSATMGVAEIPRSNQSGLCNVVGVFWDVLFFFRNLLMSRCYVGFMSMSVFSRSKNNTKTRKKTEALSWRNFMLQREYWEEHFFFLFTYLGSTFSGSLGIIMLLLPTSSPLQKIGLTFTFNFQPKSLKAGYALVWFEPYDNIQPVSNSDLWVDLELFKSWHFWGIYGQMACKNTTAFGDLQKSTNDVWLKSVCLHKYTYVPHILCTKLDVSYLYMYHVYIYINNHRYIHNYSTTNVYIMPYTLLIWTAPPIFLQLERVASEQHVISLVFTVTATRGSFENICMQYHIIYKYYVF